MPTKSDSDIMPCLQLPSKNINLYTAPEPMRINRSLVYKSFPVDRINTQVTYRFYVPITLQTKHEFTVFDIFVWYTFPVPEAVLVTIMNH